MLLFSVCVQLALVNMLPQVGYSVASAFFAAFFVAFFVASFMAFFGAFLVTLLAFEVIEAFTRISGFGPFGARCSADRVLMAREDVLVVEKGVFMAIAI
jgi:hypothetical protein